MAPSLIATWRRFAALTRDAFAPPGFAGKTYKHLARSLYRVRLLVGVSALGISSALPGATRQQRTLFVILVGFIYIPYAFVLLLAARRAESTGLKIASIAGDVTIVFLFQAVLPPTRIVALFGYLLILAFYTYFGGVAAGVIVSVAAMGLTLVSGFVVGATQPVDTYTLVMFGVTLVSMTLLISAVTRGQRELLQRLKESEKQLGDAQQLAQVGSWEWDLATDSVTWSDEMFRIYGYRPQEFAVNFQKAMELVIPEDHPRIGKNVEDALGRGVPEVPPIEYHIVRPDGESRVLYGRAQIAFSLDAKPIQIVGTVQDITEHKQAQFVLEEAYEREHAAADRLRELDEMKNAFLSAVSHDLRTPLTAILGFAKTVEQRLPSLSPDDSIDMVRRISSNAERLKRMLFDLLDLDRLSRGVLTPNRVSTDVAVLVCRLVDDLELGDRVVRVEAHPVVATVDPSQVERIVENLLANAERHTPAGTAIHVRVRPEDDNVLIAVDDEGPGVPDDEKRVIFERFHQGNGSHAQGSGLGLALVAEFAHLQGGKAWVEDRPGGGSSFRVLLPVDGQPSIAKAS